VIAFDHHPFVCTGRIIVSFCDYMEWLEDLDDDILRRIFQQDKPPPQSAGEPDSIVNDYTAIAREMNERDAKS
jgi:hypothetical protein